MLILRFDVELAKKVIPICIKSCESLIEIFCCLVLSKKSVSFLLIDDSRSFPLIILSILNVTKCKYECLAFASFEADIYLMRSNWIPTRSNSVMKLSFNNSSWLIRSVVCTAEFITACLETINLCIYRVNSVVITAFSVLSLMIYSRIDYFYFANRKVTLIVLHIIISIP